MISAPRKTISATRDRRQSRAITALLGTAVVLATAAREYALLTHGLASVAAVTLAATFGLLAFGLRSATAPAAAMGAVVCLALAESPAPHAPATPGLLALVALFALTFAATRFGRARKEHRGLAEARRGRAIAQILANLGVAGLLAAAGQPLAALAALAEATADTLSSEIGQARGGTTILLTTGRPVPPGTDGALSLAGTLAGIAGALAIALLSAATLHRPLAGAAVFAAALFGLVVDSLLGATLERRGLLGNDLVNLLSTAAAALFAALLAPLLR